MPAGVQLLASDVVIVEEEPQFTSLASIPTAVLGAVGVTERGPFGPSLVNGVEELTEKYGGLTATSDLTMALLGFFLNGGTTAWGVRTVHLTDVTDPASRISTAATDDIDTTGAATQGEHTSGNAEPFVLEPGDTLLVKKDGGGAETVTFDAAAADVTAAGGSTYPTLWGVAKTLLVTLNGGSEQTIDFPGSSHTLADVIDVINPLLVGGYADNDGGELRITSDLKGLGSRVEIGAGTGNAELGFTGAEDVSGTGDVQNIGAVTAAESQTLIQDDTTDVTVDIESGGEITVKTDTVGAGGSIQIDAASTADTDGAGGKFDFDNAVHTGGAAGPGVMGTVQGKTHGAYANTLSLVIEAASNGDATFFNATIEEGGIALETFPNMITTLGHVRYWETFMNSAVTGSNLVTVTDSLTGTPPGNRPTNGTYALAGGSDGLAGLADTDFVGSAAGPTGIYELDAVENLTLLIIPGIATSYAHQSMLTYCETWRAGQVFAILDCPAGNTAEQVVTYVKTTAALQEFSEYGAIYWPRIKIRNPDETLFTSDENGLITVFYSGHLAGVYARTDGRRDGGIYDPPAGVERGIIFGCLGFETDDVLDKRKRDVVYPELINPLTTWSGAPRHVDGTKTLKESGNFPTIAERRGVSNIERTIRLGLAFARHSNNTRKLRQRCRRTVYLYMLGEFGKGAFAHDTPDESFTVDFSDKLNRENTRLAKQLKGRVTVATNKPVDWPIISFAQDTRALDEQIAEAAQGR